MPGGFKFGKSSKSKKPKKPSGAKSPNEFARRVSEAFLASTGRKKKKKNGK